MKIVEELKTAKEVKIVKEVKKNQRSEDSKKSCKVKKIRDQEKIYVFMKREFMKATVNLGNTFLKAKKKTQ